jgi:hypothetical protein
MPRGYTYVLAGEVVATLLDLPKRQQWRLSDAFVSLANNPHKFGRYTETDSEGHVIQFHFEAGWWIGCWADDAVKELRITEVVQV